MEQSLGERMKRYESINKQKLIPNLPIVIRLDGKNFSKLTWNLDKPFDKLFAMCMNLTTSYLCHNIEGITLAYTQSDEITLVIPQINPRSEMWFGGNIQKIVSVSASMATAKFNQAFSEFFPQKNELAMFDSRVFQLPDYEVINCLIWRQQDATRNSIQMLGRNYFSHRDLMNKSTSEIQDMLMEKYEINWNDLDVHFKRGSMYHKIILPILEEGRHYHRRVWIQTHNTPIFSQEKEATNQIIFKEAQNNE